jgi:TRAP-type C4-dicarboxylate transport system substrate-binding protein
MHSAPFPRLTRQPLNPFSGVVALSVLAVFTTGCGTGPAVEPVREVWRFAIEESKGSVQHQYAMRFKQLIEERTDGAIEVIVYPYGTLGTSTQITEQLSLGVVEFAMASPGSLGKFIPELQVFLLHFVLPQQPDKVQEVLADPQLLASLDPLYAEKGLSLLSMYSEGQMAWTLKEEVRTPVDFSGLKMRVMTSPILLAAYGAYGASPTPMPYSEVYSGLQLNMIDGQVNPVFAIERQKFHEVTDWLIFPGHSAFVTTAAANRPFLEELSADRKALVRSVIAELDPWIFDIQTKLESLRLVDILEDRKRQRRELHLVGDADSLLSNFTAEERRALIKENPYLTLEPPLTADEIAAFRDASVDVQSVFLRIGGDNAEAILNRVLSISG